MGRGDIKTKKGKIFAGSFGKKRAAKPPKKKSTPKRKLKFFKTRFPGCHCAAFLLYAAFT